MRPKKWSLNPVKGLFSSEGKRLFSHISRVPQDDSTDHPSLGEFDIHAELEGEKSSSHKKMGLPVAGRRSNC